WIVLSFVNAVLFMEPREGGAYWFIWEWRKGPWDGESSSAQKLVLTGVPALVLAVPLFWILRDRHAMPPDEWVCPKCRGGEGYLHLGKVTSGVVFREGHAEAEGELEWRADAPAFCNCGWQGTVAQARRRSPED
ncbi:MAG: hypothetical protein L0312_25675, partial [Acidobacteria bacterium]|nr:hypothetical protein [Acidobacteriota bacterium]